MSAARTALLAIALATSACTTASGDDAGGSGGNPGTGGTGALGPGGAGPGGTGPVGSGPGGTGPGGTAGMGGTSSGGAGPGGAGPGGTGPGGAGGTGSVWVPAPGTSWQWQLTGSIDTSVDVQMYDIDLFDVPGSVISGLQGQGRKVICYFSAGSREDWRDDAGQFNSSDYGNKLDNWPGENWLDVRSGNVRAIMKGRLDKAVSKGCDGVEPDNVDGYDNNTGFPLSKKDQLDYLRHLATEAHARGLSIGLKNSVDLVADLVDDFDWALNEECLSYNECLKNAPFINAGKAVFHTEYIDSSGQGAAKKSSVCGKPSISGFSTLIKTWDLDAWRLSCD